MRRYIFIIIVVSILATVAGFSFRAKAVGIPFGGRIVNVTPCTCNGAFLITIGPPRGGQFVWFIGTPQYSYYMLPWGVGSQTLGLYTPGGVCLMWYGKDCGPFGSPWGTITETTGTSLR